MSEHELPTARDIADNSVKVSEHAAQKWLDEGRIEVHDDGSVHLKGIGRLYPWSFDDPKLWPMNLGERPDQSEKARHGETGAANREKLRKAVEKKEKK